MFCFTQHYARRFTPCIAQLNNERVGSKRKQNNLKHQTHEQSYIEDGNIVSGWLPLEKMLESKINAIVKFLWKIF